MLCYKDMTFCTYYADCLKGPVCGRALTPEVVAKAEKAKLPVARWLEKPQCFESEAKEAR